MASFTNSTSADDLYEDEVLESETNQKYAADRDSVSPDTTSPIAKFVREAYISGGY